MPKTVAQKAHVRPDATVAAIRADDAIIGSLGLPRAADAEVGTADIVCLFVRTGDDLRHELPPAVARMKDTAHLWVFFRKGSRAAGLDVNRDDVWALAGTHGMRPVSLLSVDDHWSVFRLRKG